MDSAYKKARIAVKKAHKKAKEPDENSVTCSYLETEDYILEQIKVANSASLTNQKKKIRFIRR